MSTLWHTMQWDWRMLFRGGLGAPVLLLALALSALAAWNGLQAAQAWRAQIDAAQVQHAKDAGELQDRIASGDAASALAYNARALVALPPAPLVDVAVGRSDLDPRIAKVGAMQQQRNLFGNYQIDNPLVLAMGRFDLAFLVQALLPLLIIVLGYGLLAEERERGLDRVLAVQGVQPRRLLAARLLVRSALVVVPVLAAVAILHVGGGVEAVASPQRVARLGLALLLILGYAAFWWALVAWIGTWRLRDGQTLLALLASWVLLALAVPALVGLLSREAHPPPSRFELIASARAQEIAGQLRSEALLGEYTHEHPDLDAAASADLPAWARNSFLSARAVDETTAPIVARFDDALASQQASVERWQYLSPTLLLQRGLVAAAGTDESRNAAFVAQARGFFLDYRERVGRMMLAGEKLDAQSLQGLPQFAFSEPSLQAAWQRARWPLLWLWALSAVLLLLAFRRVGRDRS